MRPEEWCATYDEEAGVIYLASPTNRAARGVEMAVDVVFRFAEDNGELVGVTLLGVPQPEMSQQPADGEKSGGRDDV